MTTTVTRPFQHISTFINDDGTYFVALSTESSSNTFYLNQNDAVSLLLSLKDTLEGKERADFSEHREAIRAFIKALPEA